MTRPFFLGWLLGSLVGACASAVVLYAMLIHLYDEPEGWIPDDDQPAPFITTVRASTSGGSGER